MPPLEHLIQTSPSAWGDSTSLPEMLKGLLENSEAAVKWAKACRRRMLFLDQEIQRRDIESDAFREEIGRLKSLEENEKDDLKRDNKSLTDQLNSKVAEIESLRSSQSETIARAKADSIAEYVASASFQARVDRAAEAKLDEHFSSADFQVKMKQEAKAKVVEYRQSPALGKLFVNLMTFVRSVGFTEGIDCLKDKAPGFSLDMVPDTLRSNYDPEAAVQVESLIAEHGIFTSFFDSGEAGTSRSPELNLDRLSNS